MAAIAMVWSKHAAKHGLGSLLFTCGLRQCRCPLRQYTADSLAPAGLCRGVARRASSEARNSSCNPRVGGGKRREEEGD
jgi:hypothetical protein